MALYRLYIDGRIAIRRLDKRLACEHDGEEILTIYSKGLLPMAQPGVKVGELYTIYSAPGVVNVDIVKRPDHTDELLMWLYSFDKKNRAFLREKYEKILAERRAEYANMKGWEERTVEGTGYAFTVFDFGDGNNVRAVAYIAMGLRVTKSLVMEVIKKFPVGMRFPRQYIYDKILKPVFRFTEEDLRELEAWEKAEGRQIIQEGFWS